MPTALNRNRRAVSVAASPTTIHATTCNHPPKATAMVATMSIAALMMRAAPKRVGGDEDSLKRFPVRLSLVNRLMMTMSADRIARERGAMKS